MTVNLTENWEENDYSGDHGVSGRYGRVSLVVGGNLKCGWCHTTFISQ